MAMHEAEHKRHEEHARKEPHHRKMARKSGGRMEDEKEPEDEDEEAHKEEHEAGPDEEPGRKHGGEMPRQKRKSGGAIKGEKPKHRPDKRARGGATSDQDPLTSAGKMSHLPFERVGPKPDGGGKGMDRD